MDAPLPIACLLLSFLIPAVGATGQELGEGGGRELEVGSNESLLGSERTISDEFRLDAGYQTSEGIGKGINGGILFTRYVEPRLHDDWHRNSLAEMVGEPTTFARIGFGWRPNVDLRVENEGYDVEALGALRSGDLALGATFRFRRHDVARSGAYTNDYEIGPLVALWPDRRLHLREALTWRRIGAHGGALDFEEEDFVQLSHHLTWIVGEEGGLTYAHDLTLRAGLHENIHRNNLSLLNHFLFSPTTRLTWGGMLGVTLDYIVGTATSTLTIPVGGRVELFPAGGNMVTLQASYDIPTLPGQLGGYLVVRGGYAFR